MPGEEIGRGLASLGGAIGSARRKKKERDEAKRISAVVFNARLRGVPGPVAESGALAGKTADQIISEHRKAGILEAAPGETEAAQVSSAVLRSARPEAPWKSLTVPNLRTGQPTSAAPPSGLVGQAAEVRSGLPLGATRPEVGIGLRAALRPEDESLRAGAGMARASAKQREETRAATESEGIISGFAPEKRYTAIDLLKTPLKEKAIKYHGMTGAEIQKRELEGEPREPVRPSYAQSLRIQTATKPVEQGGAGLKPGTKEYVDYVTGRAKKSPVDENRKQYLAERAAERSSLRKQAEYRQRAETDTPAIPMEAQAGREARIKARAADLEKSDEMNAKLEALTKFPVDSDDALDEEYDSAMQTLRKLQEELQGLKGR